MKKFILPLILIGALILAVSSSNQNNQDLIKYKVEGKELKLLVADEQTEWERGLMYIRKLRDADGMIFIFPDKRKRSFWNKNTVVDLDVYWISDDKVVGKSFLPSIEKSKKVVVINSPEPVDKVIENIRD